MQDKFKQLGKPYATVAKQLGVSKTALINAVVHGKFPSKNTDEFKQKLSDYLGCAADELAAKSLNHFTQNDKEDTMLLKKSRLTLQTLAHFGLSQNPFDDEIRSSEDIFKSDDVRYVREYLYNTANHGGFLAVVGESGAGKSTLREDLHDRLMTDGKSVIIIEPYVLAMEDNDIKGKTLKAVHIAEAILEAVGQGEKAKRSPEARFRQVHHALMESYKAGNRHLLIIEEAHGLPIPTLKHLKRFYELKLGFQRLLGIVLIGQSELGVKLGEKDPNVREVVQRCEIATLLPLTEGKLNLYLKHKFERIGANITQVLDTSAIDAISERLTIITKGESGVAQHSLLYPLAVNNLVSAAMNTACELGFGIVDADVIKSV